MAPIVRQAWLRLPIHGGGPRNGRPLPRYVPRRMRWWREITSPSTVFSSIPVMPTRLRMRDGGTSPSRWVSSARREPAASDGVSVQGIGELSDDVASC